MTICKYPEMSYIIAENTYLVHLKIIVDLCMRTVYWLSCRHKIFRILSNGLLKTYVLLIIGKKRAQCNVCLKTFCDRGALKIHFSAVHLREMHKCNVEGEFKKKSFQISSNERHTLYCTRFFPYDQEDISY